jgi:hypothetical protein
VQRRPVLSGRVTLECLDELPVGVDAVEDEGPAMRRLPPDSERPSRTQRKLAAEAVVELAHQLAALPDVAFRGLPLPKELREEFTQARNMKACAARAPVAAPRRDVARRR